MAKYLILLYIILLAPSSGQGIQMPIKLDYDSSNIPDKIDITQGFGSMNYNAKKQVLEYTDDFTLVTDSGIEMSAKHAHYDLVSGIITLRNDVSIYNNGILQKSQFAQFNTKNQDISSKKLRLGVQPFLLKSKNFEVLKEKDGTPYYLAKNAAITTHDIKKPGYWVKADRIKLVPDNYVLLKNMKLKIGNQSIFWLPYFYQSLHENLGYRFEAGAKSHWGAFLVNKYGAFIESSDKESWLYDDGDPWLLAKYQLDIRTRRGLAIGSQFQDNRVKNPNLTGLSTYYTYDFDPSISRTGINRSIESPHRYKLKLAHRHTFKNYNLDVKQTRYLDFNFTYLSDEHYLEDFEINNFTVDPTPVNRLSYIHKKNNWLAGLTSDFKVNDFYDANLSPEVFLNYIKSPLGNTNIFYQGSLSAGLYKEHLSDDTKDSLNIELNNTIPGSSAYDELLTELNEEGYGRVHTLHQFSHAISPAKGLSIVPYLNFGYTQYFNQQDNVGNFGRHLLQAGVDLSLTFSKKYENVKLPALGLDSLLHVIKPYANFSYLDTGDRPSNFREIYRLTDTTELRALNINETPYIDALEDWSILRLGLINNFITRRNGESHTWLSFNSYLDFYKNDPEFDRINSNLYTQVNWHPLPWVECNLKTQIPLTNEVGQFSEYVLNTEFMPNRSTEIGINYRSLNSHPTLTDSNFLEVDSYYRLNEQWGIGSSHTWQLDDGVLEFQEYSVYKDIGGWSASLGVSQSDNRLQKEYAFGLRFTLKDLPSLNLPLTYDPN